MKKFTLFLLVGTFVTGLSAQQLNETHLTGNAAEEYIPGAIMVRLKAGKNVPSFIKFRNGKTIPDQIFPDWFAKQFASAGKITITEYEREYDELGYVHVRYVQTYNGIQVQGARVYAHYLSGKLISFNGDVYPVSGGTSAGITEAQALDQALRYINATEYKWQLSEEEAEIKTRTGNEAATYYPSGQLTFCPNHKAGDSKYRLAYKFDIYAHSPVSRNEIFIDAQTGEVLLDNELIHEADVVGTAVTAYSGTQVMTADSFSGSYRLRETGRGNGIETYNMQNGTSYGAAVDFTDADNYWNNANAQQDEYATDAHWGSEMTYDYYMNEHGRNSIDGAGYKLRSYIHYDNNYGNAFWDGTRMTYGDGSGGLTPFTALDIAGHEITHGLTTNTADLVYSNESGALNESFSDIFGVSIEHYARPGNANWLMGEDIGTVIRSMSNPNTYGDPDTYGGTNWYTGTADNGGVHTNSGVQNYWYYILVNGGTGTNDLGSNYNVTALGLQNASAIAFRNLTVYLTTNSDYADARFYAIQSATDLFGPCSPEVIATTDAWYAVGVGTAFNPTVTADFISDFTQACQAPFTVSFTNTSQTAGTFTWDFGDGNNSTLNNPTHTYTAPGTYTVTLYADGGACGNDTEVKTAYINIDAANPCVAIMPSSGAGSMQTSCQGLLYDSGGPGANYSDNTNSTITISPAGATNVTLFFSSFNFELNYDYLYIYDGPSTASPLIGQYTGSSLPNGGTITSTGASITLRQSTDPGVTASGFELEWACLIPNTAPIAQFTSNLFETCNGEIHFTDQSLMLPTSWLWNFGDGNTSTLQNPVHNYAAQGTYTVTLTATNAFGNDTEVKTSYVVVDYPDAPSATNAGRCDPGTMTLGATGNGGILNWYNASTGGTLLGTGTSYTTPSISTTTSYYIEEVFGASPGYVGPTDNTIGTGGYFTGDQHLIFDCYKPVTLVSVWVDANGSGNRTVELRSATGTVLQSTVVNIPNGQSRVTLNFDVPVGTNLQLGTAAGSSPNLYRNNAGPAYPYSLAGVIDITSSSAGAAYYYHYYDWEIQEPYCVSERAQATAAIATAPVATDETICSGSTATVTASGSGAGTLHWYDAPIGGTLIFSGNPFVTPTLSSTTTYYIEEELLAGPSQYVGPSTNAIGTGGMFSGDQYLIFDVTTPIVLQSVMVYAGTAGNRTIELRSSAGALLQSVTVNIPVGQSRVTLNFDIAAGTNYRLGTLTGSAPDLYRNNAGVSYPYSLPGMVSITNSSAGTDYYYHFYDWEVHEPACNTVRNPVTVTVNNQADATITPVSNICASDPTFSFTAASSGGVWTGAGITNSPTGQFDPSVAGNGAHDIIYTIPGTCGDADTLTVFVNGSFDATITPVADLCENSAPFTVTSADMGSVWSATCGSCIDGTTGSFNPALAGPGTHTVTSTFLGSCGSVDTETITVLSNADATISPQGVLCSDGTNVILSAADAGGIWSGTGIINSSTGEFSPSVAGAGTFTISYTISGTCGATGNINIQVDARLDASISPAGPYCDGQTPVTLNSMMSGGTWSGNGIVNSTTGIFDPTTAGVGTHTITYTLAGACGDSQSISVQVDNCTGIEQTDAFEFAVYPNPTDGLFRVGVGNNKALGTVAIVITDLTGRVVEVRKFTSSQQRHLEIFDLNKYADGTYVVSIFTGVETLRARVVKQ